MKKVFLPLFLILCMVLLLAPTVSAAETYVAQVAQTREKYKTLQEAFDATPDGTVMLLADCTQDVHIESGYHSLYLNGYTITGTVKMSSGYLNMHGPGTIQNTGVDGKYPVSCLGGNYYLGDVTVTATAQNGVAVYSNGNKLMTNGSPVVNGNVQVDYFGIFNINGGTYNGSLICNEGGSLTVNGGSFKNDPSSLVPGGYKVAQSDGYYNVSVDERVTIDALTTDSEGAYLLKTPGDVVVFRTLLSNTEGKNILSGKVFKLADDIDMAGVTLGAAGNDNKRFMGTFDGQNNTISNVNIQGGSANQIAFFGNTSGATLKNLTLNNVTVKGGNYTAGLVGYTRNTTIENCKITGDIDIEGGSKVAAIHGGGVVSITGCEVNGTGSISGSIDVGGISGLLSEGSTTVKDNRITGITVNGNGLTGGLIGRVIASNTALYVSDNIMTNVSVVSTASSYDQNGLAVGCLQVNNNSSVHYSNTFVNSTLTVDGDLDDTVYCNTNYDGTKAEDTGASILDPVAMVGEDAYFTLQSAIDNAPDGAEIEIVTSFALTAQNANPLMKIVYNRESYCGVYIPDDKKLTIDLNGNAITYVDEYYDCDNVMILNFGDLTINDSVGGGKISYKPVAGDTTYSYFYSTVFNCGTLTINAGTIENTCETATDVSNAVDNHSRLSHEYGNDCILVVNGGTLIGAEYRAIRQYTHYFEGVQNRVTINGGTVMGGIYMQHGDSWYYSDASSNRLNVDCYLTINGGTITTIRCADGTDYGHIRMNLNNPDNESFGLEINGGIIEVPVQVRVQKGYHYVNGVSGATTYESTGASSGSWLEENGGFISGGLFTDLGTEGDATTDLRGFLVEGYTPFEMAPGEWGVAVEGADITVTYTGYHSVTVVAGTVLSEFVPDNDGYELVGWFTDPEFINKCDFSRPFIVDTILYPCWRADKHDIDTGFVMIVMKMLEKLDISVEIIEAEGGKIVVVVPEKIKYNKPAFCTVIPDDGYEIKDVIVDGESVGAVSEYTIERLKGKHTVTAVFEQIKAN